MSILTDAQRTVLTAAVNRIIPAEGKAPAAGNVGAVEAIEAEIAATPADRRCFLDGIAAIDLVAWRDHDRGFVDLDAEARDHVLRAVEVEQTGFFAFLVSRTYRVYYTSPDVLAVLGIESRPPQPLGHTLTPFDPSVLTRVRERGPVYRKVGDEG